MFRRLAYIAAATAIIAASLFAGANRAVTTAQWDPFARADGTPIYLDGFLRVPDAANPAGYPIAVVPDPNSSANPFPVTFTGTVTVTGNVTSAQGTAGTVPWSVSDGGNSDQLTISSASCQSISSPRIARITNELNVIQPNTLTLYYAASCGSSNGFLQITFGQTQVINVQHLCAASACSYQWSATGADDADVDIQLY